MSRNTKKFATLLGAVGILTMTATSCSLTDPFCTPTDKTQQMYNFYAENVVNSKQSDENGIFEVVYDENGNTTFSQNFYNTVTSGSNTTPMTLPSTKFTNFIDQKVKSYIEVDSNFSAEINAISDNFDNDAIELRVKRSLALFGGYDEDPATQVLWKNYDRWVEEYTDANQGTSDLPSTAFINFFKSTINNGAATMQACITANDGVFSNGSTYIQGKTWGEAFSEYGFLEGLLVYPIAIMLEFFTNSFGNTGIGQVLAILIVTFIVRLVLVIVSIFTQKSQNKMTELQPEIALLQQKYPNAETDSNQKAQLAQETRQIYKKNGVHPFLQFGILIIQFPLFICVWAALQGSAVLSSGSFLGLSLTATISEAFMSFSGQSATAAILFLMLCVSQFISTMMPQWFQSWTKKKFVRVTVQSNVGEKQEKTMKIVSVVMIVFICFMGISLPSAMAMYWFFGALITIFQTLFMQLLARRSRRKGSKGGDGSSLAYERRSKNNDKKTAKKVKSIRSSR